MNFPRFLSEFGLSHPAEIRAARPTLCAHCKAHILEPEDHEESCPVVMEPLARKARARQRGDIPLKAYFMLYGVLFCLLAIGLILWRVFA